MLRKMVGARWNGDVTTGREAYKEGSDTDEEDDGDEGEEVDVGESWVEWFSRITSYNPFCR